ncbi:hypothetical protein CLOLEP_01368 [[Clostridium] leptum DSM 753]|uniref:Uncharacterized protein n=1 Tax=[Clostridium] leptum DSM 753 TaxID=428125 RepID=A7VS31_9FIRM|nr:hypothetical protein CLOLEP_01368 [[Clostridium] leptum DSM 753]MCC3320242.1 DUF6353 family protein [[Clostridium] innocuum]PEQ23838.1 hypothetical protein CH238_11830 [[Clostridium] leptum DSM 753]
MKNKTEIMKSVNGVASKTVMKLKKHSPEILVVAGIAGTVVSAVLACKATTKVAEILDETKGTLDTIHEGMETGAINGQEYTTEDGKKDTVVVYAQTGMKLAKLYAPAIILGTLSITSILASNNILRKCNVALGAAYAAIDKSFKEYRGRVIERFGEQVDTELKYGIKAKKFEEIEVDPETGKEKKVKKTVMVADPNLQSDYAVYFDSKSRNYETNPDYNRMFLKAQQAFANDKLQTRGHLFLNEVLDDLDLPRTPAGQIVGWTKDGPDGYVNFRIVEVERETEDGRHEPALLLDFNVEGNIWEKM